MKMRSDMVQGAGESETANMAAALTEKAMARIRQKRRNLLDAVTLQKYTIAGIGAR